MTKKILFIITAITCFLFILNSAVYCNPANIPVNPGNKPFDPGNKPAVPGATNAPLDIFAAKGIKSGLIKVDKNIFYSSDTLEIAVVFPKSLKALWDGRAEAYLVIRMADGSFLTPFPVITSDEVPDMPKTLASIDLSDQPIATGEYQIAMILVNPGGDALDLSDWYNGFNGLISATTFKYNDQCDPLDTDCDGFIDLSVTPSSLTISQGTTADITIAGGTSPYTVVSNDTDIATVGDPSNGVATVSGFNIGSTIIVVTDDIGASEDIYVTVKVD